MIYLLYFIYSKVGLIKLKSLKFIIIMLNSLTFIPLTATISAGVQSRRSYATQPDRPKSVSQAIWIGAKRGWARPSHTPLFLSITTIPWFRRGLLVIKLLLALYSWLVLRYVPTHEVSDLLKNILLGMCWLPLFVTFFYILSFADLLYFLCLKPIWLKLQNVNQKKSG